MVWVQIRTVRTLTGHPSIAKQRARPILERIPKWHLFGPRKRSEKLKIKTKKNYTMCSTHVSGIQMKWNIKNQFEQLICDNNYLIFLIFLTFCATQSL